mgnify:CR=1 FL=1
MVVQVEEDLEDQMVYHLVKLERQIQEVVEVVLLINLVVELEVQAVQQSYGSCQHFSSLYPSTHNNLNQGFIGSWILK